MTAAFSRNQSWIVLVFECLVGGKSQQTYRGVTSPQFPKIWWCSVARIVWFHFWFQPSKVTLPFPLSLPLELLHFKWFLWSFETDWMKVQLISGQRTISLHFPFFLFLNKEWFGGKRIFSSTHLVKLLQPTFYHDVRATCSNQWGSYCIWCTRVLQVVLKI